MAEVAGLVASIIAILELSAKVLGYLNDVKDASTDRARCALEVATVHGLLEKLRHRIEEHNDPDSWFQSARDVIKGGLLDQFEEALMSLHDGLTAGGRFRRAADALKWKFKKEEVREILNRVGRFNTVMITALQMDQFELLKAVKVETKHIPAIKSMLDEAKQKAFKEDLKALADWLSPSTYPAEYAAKLKERQDGTGEWFIRLHEVETWLNTPKSTLLCCGELGTGKSMLSAILIEHLLKTVKSETIGVAWVFIHHNAKEDDPGAKLLAALLKQLVQSHAKIAEDVNTLFKRHVKEETGMSQDDTVKMLFKRHVKEETKMSQDDTVKMMLDFASTKLTTTYIVVDALDEFTDATQRDRFVKYLQSLQSFADVRIVVTSQFVTKELQSAPRLRVKAQSDDIKRYVAGQIDRLPDFVQEDSSLQSQVQEKIASSVGDMFLLATLHLDVLSDEVIKKDFITTLNGLSDIPVNEAYQKVLNRIKSQGRKRAAIATRALAWIALARRPMTELELIHALGVEAESKTLDRDNLLRVGDIQSMCAGLITIEEKRRLVRLVHSTARSYLEDIVDELYPGARVAIARTCLTYLCYNIFSTGRCLTKADMKDRYRQNKFLLYAAEYWGEHARSVQREVCNLVCTFLHTEGRYPCAAQALFVSKQPLFWDELEARQDRSLTACQYMAQHGLCHVMNQFLCAAQRNSADLLNPKVILNNSGTPLAIAAAREDVTLVKILIRRGASDGADVLHQAIHRNQQQIVKVLLDSKVPADSVSDGMSALSNAVSRSCPEIVQMLLKKNADITLANTSQPSGSVLMAATLADDVRIMEMLLKAGADPSVGGWPYADPLEAVIDQGHMRALSVLLANPQVKQQRSALNNALKAAAKGGCDDAAKALLNADADPNTILDGNNLLEIAAKNGHPEVVKVLYPVVLDRKGQSLEDYLYIAEQMPAFDASQAGRDVPELGEESASDFVSDSDDDIDISIPNSLGRSTQESEMEDWHRWIERRDTLLSGTITNKQAQHTQKSSSSMGVYDDDSD